MNEMVNVSHQRGIEDVTRDIRIKTGQFLMDAIDIGRLLIEAKAMVEPGKWMEYVEQELPFSHSWANNYMRLYKELGGEQLSLFSDCQALANLRPTQALELLTLPDEQRQEFLQTHDVENMSTRELKQAIRERDEERAARESAEEDRDKARVEAELLRSSTKAAQDAADRLREELSKAQEGQAAAAKKVESIQKKLDKAKAEEKAAQEQLQKLRENPEVPESVMEQMRQEVAAEAAKQATEELQKELDAANSAKADADKAREDAEQKLAAAQKALQLASPDAAVFKVLFQQVQEDFNRLQGTLLKVQQADPETARKLRSAVAALLEKLKNDLEE